MTNQPHANASKYGVANAHPTVLRSLSLKESVPLGMTQNYLTQINEKKAKEADQAEGVAE